MCWPRVTSRFMDRASTLCKALIQNHDEQGVGLGWTRRCWLHQLPRRLMHDDELGGSEPYRLLGCNTFRRCPVCMGEGNPQPCVRFCRPPHHLPPFLFPSYPPSPLHPLHLYLLSASGKISSSYISFLTIGLQPLILGISSQVAVFSSHTTTHHPFCAASRRRRFVSLSVTEHFLRAALRL